MQDPVLLLIGITDFIVILVDYFIMKPINKDVGLGFRVFSTLIGVSCIMLAFR